MPESSPHRGSAATAGERKRDLRREMRRRLDGLVPDARTERAAAVAERALALPEVARARGVLTCLSYGSELDTWPLVERLLADPRAGHRVFVPRSDPADGRLHVHPYPCELETLGFGLRQPRRGEPAVPREEIDRVVDVVLVLGLAFDADGYRLGHGHGYFDRFLAGRPFPAVGLAYGLQVVERLPREPHDVPMAALVTEAATLYTPTSSSRRANIPGV